MHLMNYIEGNALIFLDLMVCNLPVEVDIVRQDEYLFDIGAGYLIVDYLRIVVADGDKLPNDCADNKQRT